MIFLFDTKVLHFHIVFYVLRLNFLSICCIHEIKHHFQHSLHFASTVLTMQSWQFLGLEIAVPHQGAGSFSLRNGNLAF